MFIETSPAPLQVGFTVAERFVVQSVLGRGGFGIAYKATDTLRGDEVVLKELAPTGALRTDGAFVDLSPLGETTAHRLRRRFVDEAKSLARLHIPGVPAFRYWGAENGTGYIAIEYFSEAQTLEAFVSQNGPLSSGQAKEVFNQLLNILDAVHAKNVLHHDLKPSNVLVRPDGRILVIDFGAAREWHADSSETQTILFTPGYAPLEQMSERARRGPATDIYGAAATAYFAIAGRPPTPAPDRMNGIQLVDLKLLSANLDARLTSAIHAGLALRFEDRPQSIEEVRALLDFGPISLEFDAIEEFDERALALQNLRFNRHECPACGDLLVSPKPLKVGSCPVCRSKGSIKPRKLQPNLCPSCMAGFLRIHDNDSAPVACAICKEGLLKVKRTGIVQKKLMAECELCSAKWNSSGDTWVLCDCPREPGRTGESAQWSEWRIQSGRKAMISVCDTCQAQYDWRDDGRLSKIGKNGKEEGQSYYPEEWERIANGLDPGCGTHLCSTCEADFFVEGEQVTLLGSFDDPFKFTEEHLGRMHTWGELLWLGVGKESPMPGLCCPGCCAEFDFAGDYLRLIRSRHPLLRKRTEEIQTLQDWKRIALGLPTTSEEKEFYEQFDRAIVDAFRVGGIVIDDKGLIWKGPAAIIDSNGSTNTTITVTEDEIILGGLLKKSKIPLEAISQIEEIDDVVSFSVKGEESRFEIEIEEIQVDIPLKSGLRTINLTANDLSVRLGKLTRSQNRARVL